MADEFEGLANQMADSWASSYTSPETLANAGHIVAGTGQVVGGDKGAKEYASWAADQYQDALGQYLPELKDKLPEHRKKFEERIRQGARSWQLQRATEHNEGAGQFGTSDYSLGLLPGVGSGREIGYYKNLHDAAKRFEGDEATAGDYFLLGHFRAKEKADAERGVGARVRDAALGFVPAAAEWAASGGLAPAGEAAARVAAKKALGSLGEHWIAGKVAGAVGQGVARTLANPGRIAAGAMREMSPQGVEQNAQGEMQVTPGHGITRSVVDAAVGDVIENATFSGLDVFKMPRARTIAKGALTVLAAGEVSEDAKHIAQVAPQGGAAWRVAFGDPRGRLEALKDLGVNAAAAAVFETAAHSYERMRRSGVKIDEKAFHESVAEEALKAVAESEANHAARQEVAPAQPAPGAQPPQEVQGQGGAVQGPQGPEVQGAQPGPQAPQAEAVSRGLPGAEGNAGVPAGAAAASAEPRPQGQPDAAGEPAVSAGGRGSLSPEELSYAGKPSGPGGSAGGGPAPTPYSIIETAAKLFDVPYYVDKVKKQAAAVYEVRPEAIKVGKMSAGDAPVFMHEVAHDIDKTLDLITLPKMARVQADVATGLRQMDYMPQRVDPLIGAKEGFAEYLRMRVTDQLKLDTPEKQAAGRYIEQSLTAHPDILEKLGRVQGMFERFGQQSAVGQAGGFISTTGEQAKPELRPEEQRANLIERARASFDDNVDDRFAALSRMETAATRRGMKIQEGKGPRDVFFHLAHQSGPMADDMLKNGVFTYKPDAQGNMARERIGKPLDAILAALTPEDKAPWDGGASKFEVYAVGRHVLQEGQRGRPVIDAGQDAYYRAAMKEMGKDAGFMKRAKAAANELTVAFDTSLDALAEVGMLDRSKVEDFKEKRPTYVPTSRVRQDVGFKSWFSKSGEQTPSPIKVRTGSGEAIVSPVLSYIERLKMTSHLLAEQMRRRAVHEVAKGEGMGDFMIQVPHPSEAHRVDATRLQQVMRDAGIDPMTSNIILTLFGDSAGSYFTPGSWNSSDKPHWTVMVDGKPVDYRVKDRPLYDLLTNQQGDSNAFVANFLRPLANVFGPFARATRYGATTLSHTFQARNVFPTHDPAEFLTNTASGKSLLGSVKDLAKFYGESYRYAWNELTGKPQTNPVMEEYHKAGGRGLREYPIGQGGSEQAYAEAMGQKQGLGHVVVEGGKQLLEVMGAGEHGPRAAEFNSYLEKAGYTPAVIERNLKAHPDRDPVPFDVQVAAMKRAAEVTVPFARKGIVTAEIGKSIPFFGPHIASMSKELRNWKAAPRRAATALASYMALEALHWYTYKDEDWYKEISPSDRTNNFVVKMPWGQLWYIPKPRGLLNHATTLFQEGLRSQSQSNPDFAGWVGQTASGITPPLAPQPLAAAGQVAMNRSWTGSPIVPRAEENASALDKATKYQAPYMADQLTGGMASTRRARVNPFGRTTQPHYSIEQFYDRAQDVERTFQEAKHAGAVDPKVALEHGRMTEYRQLDHALLKLGKEGEDKAALEKYRLGVAHAALGQPPAQDYPLPYLSEGPAAVKGLGDRWLAEVVTKAIAGDETARAIVTENKIPQPKQVELYRKLHAEHTLTSRGLTPSAAKARVWGSPGDTGERKQPKPHTRQLVPVQE